MFVVRLRVLDQRGVELLREAGRRMSFRIVPEPAVGESVEIDAQAHHVYGALDVLDPRWNEHLSV
jgi:hypothetical protein